MKRIWNGSWCLIFASIILYVVGYFFEIPLLMWKHEVYVDDYLVDTKRSVLPLLLGSLLAVIVTRK